MHPGGAPVLKVMMDDSELSTLLLLLVFWRGSCGLVVMKLVGATVKGGAKINKEKSGMVSWADRVV